MRIAFSTSRELNGTALLRDNLQKLGGDWIAVDSYRKIVWLIAVKSMKISSIYCLSDIHCIFAHATCRLFGRKIPIILGYYHPDQWQGSLDRNISRRRAECIKKIIASIPDKNIVFSSKKGAAVASFHIGSRCSTASLMSNIVPGPVIQATSSEDPPIRPAQRPLKIITIGRFVKFKISTVLAMMEVIDSLVSEGYDITYSVFGDGPCHEQLIQRQKRLANPRSFRIEDSVSDENYEQVCLQHDVFFGMGGAVIRAAMLKMPSIVAIQRCEEDQCFGLVSRHDHFATPVFGDDDSDLKRISIRDELLDLYNCQDLHRIGIACHEASAAYGVPATIHKLNSIVDSAEFYEPRIFLFDLIAIKFEAFISRVLKKAGLDL